jgi:putative inorganic carbon (hco3(-)) transporter
MLIVKRFFSLENSIILTFCILLVLSPSIQLIQNVFLHDGQRLISLFFLVLILLHSALNKASICNLLPIDKKIRYWFLLLLALAIATATIKAQMVRLATIEISIFAALCYLSLFVSKLYIENKDAFIKTYVYILWASISLYMVGFYIGYITASIADTPLKWPQPFFGFTNIRLFNQYQLWTIGLISLPILAFNLKKNIIGWLYIALACWWILLFYSASRGVLVSWAVGIVATALIFKKTAFSFLRIQIINIITGLSAYYLLFKLIPSLQQHDIVTGEIFRGTTYDRIGLWNVCIKMIEHHPILGLGQLHYSWYTNLGTHPHNSILQLAAEWGVPATLLIIALASYGLYYWYKKLNTTNIKSESNLDKNLTIVLFFTVITNAAYSLVDGVIVMPISQVLMFTVIGIMIGQYYCKENPDIAYENNRTKFRFRPFFAGVLLIALVWSTLPEIIQGLSGNPRGFSTGPHLTNPRIWVQPYDRN